MGSGKHAGRSRPVPNFRVPSRHLFDVTEEKWLDKLHTRKSITAKRSIVLELSTVVKVTARNNKASVNL